MEYPFKLDLVNFPGMKSQCPTLDEAKAEAKRICFEAIIYTDEGLVCTYSPIGGFVNVKV